MTSLTSLTITMMGPHPLGVGTRRTLRRLTHLRTLEIQGADGVIDQALSVLSSLSQLETLMLSRSARLNDSNIKVRADRNCRISCRSAKPVGQTTSRPLAVLVQGNERVKTCFWIGDHGIIALDRLVGM